MRFHHSNKKSFVYWDDANEANAICAALEAVIAVPKSPPKASLYLPQVLFAVFDAVIAALAPAKSLALVHAVAAAVAAFL